ncbi:uncharacterized protein EI97DRAFT_118962 [Westerdykella ornata]|uniref:Uncharacterized protein n=1 Tax=Westerdykella ornata TaxID=318751 RepID=A0A6A6JZ44_WESOR|nr:uncharacterized protein EI97DRAFT_118962 [Westerdykella ornata]KAF2280319.1 hypothetical protein EI97DRAFT_118962 [Westerdykella ornata]
MRRCGSISPGVGRLLMAFPSTLDFGHVNSPAFRISGSLPGVITPFDSHVWGIFVVYLLTSLGAVPSHSCFSKLRCAEMESWISTAALLSMHLHGVFCHFPNKEGFYSTVYFCHKFSVTLDTSQVSYFFGSEKSLYRSRSPMPDGETQTYSSAGVSSTIYIYLDGGTG